MFTSHKCQFVQLRTGAILIVLVTLFANDQALHAQTGSSEPDQGKSAASGDQSLADHPLLGWWALDSEKTVEEITASVKDPALRDRMLGNASTFHFHFRPTGECTVLIARAGEGTWSAGDREPNQGSISIRIGNSPMGFKYVFSEPTRVSVQPERQPFKIFLRQLKQPVTDPEKLRVLFSQLDGAWQVSLEKTNALHTARKFPNTPELNSMLEGMGWDFKDGLLSPRNGVGPSLKLQPLAAEVDDWQAKEWNGIVLGKADSGMGFSWEMSKGEAVFVIEGLPVVVQRDETQK